MLNSQQQAVIAHGDTPALVIAGAGTGKTTVMVHRAVALLERGCESDRLLLLTFTRRAAEELKVRVSRALAGQQAFLPWCGTFHSIAARLLRRHCRHVDLPPSFSILDEADSRDMLQRAAKELFPVELAEDLFPAKGQLARIYSYMRNTDLDLEEVVKELYGGRRWSLEQIGIVINLYEQRKHEQTGLDFDDLLITWLRLLDAPDFDCSALFDAILVDEYQDTNTLQARILKRLCRHHRNIMVVGDDAQAIYAFRGATVENILEFEREFTGAKVLMLEENYRSHQEILDAANALLADMPDDRVYQKFLHAARGAGQRPLLLPVSNEWEQAEQVAERVFKAWRQEKVPLLEQAVLFRSSQHSFRLETCLRRLSIPFKKFGGQRFADGAHIKDVVAFLRCAENPADETAWRRVLCLLPGVGEATAGKFCQQLSHALSPVDALAQLKLAKAAQPFRDELLAVFTELFDPDGELDVQLAAVIAFYRQFLDKLFDNPESRLEDVNETRAIAAQKHENRRQFLDELQVGDDSLLGENGETVSDYLTLSTIHSAKGCEWLQVHLLSLVEGGLPGGASQEDAGKLEEERRLLYVAMTRAKERLYLYQPLTREKTENGERIECSCTPSRFLTPEVMACIDKPRIPKRLPGSAWLGGGESDRSTPAKHNTHDSNELIYEPETDPHHTRGRNHGAWPPPPRSSSFHRKSR